MGTDTAMMWQALMMFANPYKVGTGHLLMGHWSEPDFKTACGHFALTQADRLLALDKDRVALIRLGVW